MRPRHFVIAQWLSAVIVLALVLAISRYSPTAAAWSMLGVVLLAIGAYLYRSPAASTRLAEVLRRPVGGIGFSFLVLILSSAPYVLFFDPVGVIPWRAHSDREPKSIYLLFSDDVAYIAGSRTWSHTVSNLLMPHNTHIVPAWRIVTWALVRCAGNVEGLPEVFAIASYSILVIVMLLTGRLVARETGRNVLGLAAMALVGTTSLMLAPATWYSAGQPLWAGTGILATLWYSQFYRRSGRKLALLFAAVSALIAGGFWTVGHMAGPTSAVYLWVDGRRRCRLAAIVPLAASILAIVLSLALAARPIDATISFHGRTAREAFDLMQGVLHTAQAIPENLVFANVGLSAETTPIQGIVLTLGLLVLWTQRAWRQMFRSRSELAKVDRALKPGLAGSLSLLGPLECAGAALLLGSYLVEWSFRGYFEFRFLRTINSHFMVPWYDIIPQIGAVLLALGWWSARKPDQSTGVFREKPLPATWLGALGVVALASGLIVVNRPRVENLVRSSVHALLPSELMQFQIPKLQTMRANTLLERTAEWQRAHLRRLDKAQELARRLGLGRDALHAALGHPFVSGAVQLLPTRLYEHYDAIGILDLPDHGRDADPASVREALAPYFAQEPEWRPPWLSRSDSWPPAKENSQAK
jgi:hypothetical protein